MTINKAFRDLESYIKTDRSYAWTWQCNIACAFIDSGANHEQANRAAASFMLRTFGVDVTKFEQWGSFPWVIDDVVTDYIKSTRNHINADVIRSFWNWPHSDAIEGCQKAVDEACAADWHTPGYVRGTPIYVCAKDYHEDLSVGVPWTPREFWAIRRDDGTQFILTPEEEEKFIILACGYEPSDD